MPYGYGRRGYNPPGIMSEYFEPGTYDTVQGVADAAYARQLLGLLQGGGNVTQGRGAAYDPGRPQPPAAIENPFVSGEATVGGEGDRPEFARARAIAANPQGDPQALGRAMYADAGFTENPTPTAAALASRQARQQESDRMWKRIQDWKRSANPSAGQYAQVMNAFQSQFSDSPNPLDVVKTQDENDPIVGLARDREQIRRLPGYEPAWEQMVDPETGRLDFGLLNDWRKTSLEMAKQAKDSVGVSAEDRRQAYEDEIQGLEVFKPTKPGKDAEPGAMDAYRQEQMQYLQMQRQAREKFYGPANQYFHAADAGGGLPAPAGPAAAPGIDATEQVKRAKQISETLNLPFVGSHADYQGLIESGELTPGEYFIDDSGTPYLVGPDGKPVRK